MEYDESSLAAERDKHKQWLNQQPGVAGAGIGLDSGGRVCIKIFTNRMTPDTKHAIASRLADLPINFEETGEFRAL